MNAARVLCALVCIVVIPAAAGAQSNTAAAAVRAYLHSVFSEDYARAFRALDSPSRRYYGSERNYSSWFRALHIRLRAFRIVPGVRGVNVDEHLTMFDPSQSRDVPGTRRVRYGVTRENGKLYVRDREHPRQTFVPPVEATVDGAHVAVDDVGLYEASIAIRLTLAKTDSGFATFLPYNKSVLKDQDDRVYPLLVSRDWRVTDKMFFLGVRLAGNAQYTGTMRFRIPHGAQPRELHLEIAPVVREDGRLEPFAVALPPMKLVLP